MNERGWEWGREAKVNIHGHPALSFIVDGAELSGVE
jgi:hypothetical protein